MLPIAARAQCAGGLITNCPPAVNPQPTDLLLLYQLGQNPHSRQLPLSQTLVIPFSSPPPIGNVTPNTGAFTTLSGSNQLSLTYSPSTPSTDVGWLVNAQSTVNFPAAGHDFRDRFWKTTATLSGSSSGIWEPNFLECNHAGTGTATVETNCLHPHSSYQSGVTISGGTETFETSMDNFAGTISGAWTGALSQITSNTGTIGSAYGFNARYGQNTGSMTVWAGYNCDPGSGNQPTFNLCLRNADPNAYITSLGHASFGTLGPATNNVLLVAGPDTSGSTFPFVVQNSTPTTVFTISDSGGVTTSGTLAPATYAQIGPDNSSGTFPFTFKSAALTRIFDINDGGNVYAANLSGISQALVGADNSSGTFPFTVKSLALTRLFDVNDGGGVYAANLTGISILTTGPDTSGSTFPLAVKNSTPTTLLAVADNGAITTFGTFALDPSGNASVNSVIAKGTKFTISGCAAGTTVGGATAGTFLSGTSGACTVVITLAGASGITAPNGWTCAAEDLTTPANLISQSASSPTTCTVTGTTVSGDKIAFAAIAY
jgi:hypothetical protein